MSIDVNYFSFSPSRANKQWHHFKEDIIVLRKKYVLKKENVLLNKRQELLKKAPVGFLFSAQKRLTRSELFFDLKIVDLYYGSIRNEDFEDPKMEYFYLEAFVHYLSLKTEDSVPIKKEWIRLYSNITPELIRKVAEQMVQKSFQEDEITEIKKIMENYVMQIYEFIHKSFHTKEEIAKALRDYLKIYLPPEDAKTFLDNKLSPRKQKEERQKRIKEYLIETKRGIISYLKSVRPVVEDLKKTPDAVFIRFYGGGKEVEPQSAELLLLKRAQKHAIKYKGLLPSVL